LLIHIADLYTKDFPQINRINEIFNRLRGENLFPFIASHLQLNAAGHGTNWAELLQTSQMRLLIKLGEMAGSCVFDYARGIDKCELIIKEIDQELR
jgi:hypothetical protein